MICKNCNTKNRKGAKYCRSCGNSLPVATTKAIDRLIGLDSVKKQIENIIEMQASLQMRPETKDIRLSVNTLIIGGSGTGKTLLSHVLKDVFFENKIIKFPLIQTVDAANFERFANDWDSNIQEIKGGILFIDNAHRLLQPYDSIAINKLDKLWLEMSYWHNDPVVFLAGSPDILEKFIENTPSVKNRFKYIFRMHSYEYEDLRDICVRQLNELFGGIQLSPEAFEKLTSYFKDRVQAKDILLENGHYTRKVAEQIFQNYISNDNKISGIIQPDDIY